MRFGIALRGLTLFALVVCCTSTARASTPADQLQDFDDELRRVLHRIATADLSTCEEARAASRSFEAKWLLLRTDLSELAPKFDALLPLVENLQRAAETMCATSETRAEGEVQAMRALVSPPLIAEKAIIAQPGSDTCETAPLIAFGSYTGSLAGATLDGSTGCGGQGDGDVWYRVSSPSYLRFAADTIGSDFDTVLSVHLECPGTANNQVSCNDDAFGLQSALGAQLSTNQSLWIRISSFEGSGGQYQLNYGTGGGRSAAR